nr:retrotransposon protein, putative, Ty1-copia subclass [Tanacetum cinerariifolium]
MPIPLASVAPTGQQVAPEILVAHNAWIKGSKEIVGLMLVTMKPEIQRNMEPFHAHEMLQELKTLFAHMGKIVNELHAMLKLHEKTLPKNNAPALNAIRAGKNKQAYAPKPKIPHPPKREDPAKDYPAKDSICHECASGAGGLGIFVIEFNTILNSSWIYDTGCAHNAWIKGSKEIVGLMLMTMEPEIQRNLEPFHAHEMLWDLKTLFAQQAGASSEYKRFSLLQTGRRANRRKGKNKQAYAPKPKIPPPPKREDPVKDSIYHECGEIGHWKRNCPQYLVELLKKKKNATSGASGSGIFVIELNTILNSSWIYDTGCGTHICNTTQGLRASRKLKPGALSLYVVNGQREAVEAIGLQGHAPDRMCLYIDVEEHELGDLGEPTNYKAALLDPESEKWLNAINVEMQSMKYNEVWILVELPPNGKSVSSKWLFKKKTDMDGNVHTYKAHLVVKGYTQTPGIDYEETFSPVADIRAIRILIAIAVYYDYEIWQMDVKIAFLNGYLNEEVYMEQPEGFVNPKYPNRVCKMKHSIYGIKQASRQCNKRFDDEIKKFGFTQNHDEPCVYLKASGSNITFLILYVDDILIMGNNIPMLQSVKTYLVRCFAMKDLGEAAYILRIKIYRDISRQLIGLCQSAYIEKILKRYCMENSKCGSIPMQEKLKLSKLQGASTPAELKRMQNVPYASAVGSIMYVVRCTRPGVVFAQNKSAKQSIFTTSSTEAEYIAAFDASKEAVWVRKFIFGLEPISMYCDNTRAIAIANESGITKGTRHFCAKVHYLREVIEYGDIKLEKVHTYDNLANPFTKALAFPKHSEHTRNIGMLPASSLM